MNCVDVCPKGLNPTKAIGKIKELMVRRAKLNGEQQQAFVELADMEDYDLWDLLTGKAEIDDPRLTSIVEMLRKS
jgi:succinate dehydrogenase flavin-adding protein (antitoxin of CptAB toxin-antitoxin module)